MGGLLEGLIQGHTRGIDYRLSHRMPGKLGTGTGQAGKGAPVTFPSLLSVHFQTVMMLLDVMAVVGEKEDITVQEQVAVAVAIVLVV